MESVEVKTTANEIIGFDNRINNKALDSITGHQLLRIIEKNKRKIKIEADIIYSTKEYHPDTKFKNVKLQELALKYPQGGEKYISELTKLDADYPIEKYNNNKFKEWIDSLDKEWNVDIVKIKFDDLPESVTKNQVDLLSFMIDLD